MASKVAFLISVIRVLVWSCGVNRVQTLGSTVGILTFILLMLFLFLFISHTLEHLT